MDEYLFGKNNRKFLTAYQKLCDSFQEEKILFRAEEKAEIDWMIYREDSSNALAFKVGNTRKYIVKDASDVPCDNRCILFTVNCDQCSTSGNRQVSESHTHT